MNTAVKLGRSQFIPVPRLILVWGQAEIHKATIIKWRSGAIDGVYMKWLALTSAAKRMVFQLWRKYAMHIHTVIQLYHILWLCNQVLHIPAYLNMWAFQVLTCQFVTSKHQHNSPDPATSIKQLHSWLTKEKLHLACFKHSHPHATQGPNCWNAGYDAANQAVLPIQVAVEDARLSWTQDIRASATDHVATASPIIETPRLAKF